MTIRFHPLRDHPHVGVIHPGTKGGIPRVAKFIPHDGFSKTGAMLDPLAEGAPTRAAAVPA